MAASNHKRNTSRILTETYCTLREAPQHIPGRPHFSTVWRWTERGFNGVRLETYRIAGRRLTSLEAIHRFLEATQ